MRHLLNHKVAVVGAGMTRFHHRLHAEKNSRELFVEAALEAVDSVDKGMTLKDIESLYVGNFSSDLFEKQCHVAALMADWLGINPVPAVRIEDACASSGIAMQMGVLGIASGAFDVLMVGGVEKMRTLSTEAVTDTLAMASDQIYEASVGMTFPGLYAAMASAHFAKYGSTWEQLCAIAIKNHHNATMNPKAHFQEEIMDIAKRSGAQRGLTFNNEIEFLKSPLNPPVAYPLKLYDCCPVSDGAAAVILASEEVAKRYTDTPILVKGIGQASDTMALHNREDLTTLRATVLAAKKAYEMAGMGPRDMDFAEVHDCFTIAEVLATEDLGFFPKGQGGKAAEEGRTALNAEVSVNPGGGLKAKGHPVGATGAAMVYEVFKQLRGKAGSGQVKDAETGLIHNVGASGGTVVVQVYGR